jgi:hypothetical protein
MSDIKKREREVARERKTLNFFFQIQDSEWVSKQVGWKQRKRSYKNKNAGKE